jgi:hypothetical protein
MGEHLPGIKYMDEEFPRDWQEWLDDNLMRGVDVGHLAHLLATKGFAMYRDIKLMHRMCAWNSLNAFLNANPDVEIDDPVEPTLNAAFYRWLTDTAEKGIDGEILVVMLMDRGLDLAKWATVLASRLKNNEIGPILGKDGSNADFLDFWYACKKGYSEDVELYCKCLMPLNEEKVDRHTAERLTGLSLAALNGHAATVRVLLAAGAQVNVFDGRGRLAIHHAASSGHRECCALLCQKGAFIFQGDFQGNTALHFAARFGHRKTVAYLASKGQELVRLICSDKVLCKKSTKFDMLVEEVFRILPEVKLSGHDTVRYEKEWTVDGANLFSKLMDNNTRFMLPKTNKQVQDDVLARFDPRPETGIYVSTVMGAQLYIKIVATAQDLSVLLKCMFRQCAVDSVNSWQRTACMTAADENNCSTHEPVLDELIDSFGCNVSLRDIHKRRALELLIMDKLVPNAPSATQAKEEMIIERRQDELDRLYGAYFEEEERQNDVRRAKVLDECNTIAYTLSHKLWSTTRDASKMKIGFLPSNWEMYEDPDSGNYLYCYKPHNPMTGEEYDHFTWSVPPEAKSLIDRIDSLQYHIKMKSLLIRKQLSWEVYRDNETSLDFYFNIDTFELKFSVPKELNWHAIRKGMTKTKRVLGFGGEYEVMNDAYGYEFYRNKNSRECEWERPHDAVVLTPEVSLCTAFSHKATSVMQRWYSCEQCNRAWKQSPDGATRTVKICEPCVFRCHAGHKGVRFIKESAAICICQHVGKVADFMCNGCIPSETQRKVQSEANAIRAEAKRSRMRNVLQPPIFAMVPRSSAKSRNMKALSGW